jgi:hypothetical protein
VRRGRFNFLDIAFVQTPQIVVTPLVGRATSSPVCINYSPDKAVVMIRFHAPLENINICPNGENGVRNGCDNTLLADNGDDNRSVPNEESDPYEYYSRISVPFAPEGLPGALGQLVLPKPLRRG